MTMNAIVEIHLFLTIDVIWDFALEINNLALSYGRNDGFGITQGIKEGKRFV